MKNTSQFIQYSTVYRICFFRALIQGPNVLERSIIKVSLTMMLHVDLSSLCAYQIIFCFYSRNSFRVITWHNAQNEPLTHILYFSAFTGHFGYLLCADYNFHVAQSRAYTQTRADQQNFIFFPLRAKYSYARLTLCARYSHSLFKLPSGDKTGRTGAIANDTSSSRNTSAIRFARCISCDTRRKYCRQSINPNVSRD